MNATFITLNLGYIVYVGSGFLRNGLSFRIGTIVASALLAVWGALEENYTAAAWSTAFVVINVFQTVRMLRANSIDLPEEEEQIRNTVFSDLSKRDFLTLWTAGHEHNAAVGEALCSEGTPQRDLFLVIDGDIQITSATGVEHQAPPLSFVGEMSFFTNQVATADVVAMSTSRTRRWTHDDIRNLEKLNDACARALHQALGRGFAEKLATR